MAGELRLPEYEEHDPGSAQNNFAAKWFLNGFPKSGLHLATQMFRPFAKVMPPGQLHSRPWIGTFQDNSWSDTWQLIDHQMYNLCRVQPGHYMQGHCAWRQDIENFMWMAGLCHVFIYRDLRDVAVSQAYHIMSDREGLKHPGRDELKALGGFGEVLEAVIAGPETYPGVMDRWEAYAPWTSVDWVFKFRYEDVLASPAETAESLIAYGVERICGIFQGLTFTLSPEGTAEMVAAMVKCAVDRREESATFRKGVSGEWQHEFTDRHKQLFKESDKNDWLTRLGYTTGSGW